MLFSLLPLSLFALFAFTGSQDPAILLFAFVGAGILLILCLTLAAFLYERQFFRQSLREQALRVSEERFRLLIQEMQVGVLLINAQAQILVANQAALELLNCTSECTTGQPNLPRIFGEGCQFIDERGHTIAVEALPIQQAISQEKSILNEVLGLRLSHGEQRWLLVNVTPQPGTTDPTTIDLLVCTLSDITSRKRAELTLFQTAERERTIASIIRQMRQTLDLEAIFATTTNSLRRALDCHRVLVYRFNPDWSGALIAESVSQDWSVLIEPPYPKILVEVSVDNENCTIRNAIDLDNEEDLLQDTYLRENQGGFYRRHQSYRCVPDIYQAGFSPCYIELLETLEAKAYIIVPIFVGNKLWGLLAAYQNDAPRQWLKEEVKMMTQLAGQLGVATQQADLLTRTQQQSLELQEAKALTDRANRAKSEFLASMSHELRTPLNSILGFTQLMQKDLSLTAQNQDYINIVNRSGEHLLELINDILEMTKIESGRVTFHASTFDLYVFLTDLERMLRVKAESKQLKLIFTCDPGVPQFITTDKGKLRQVLINLLGNGIKFTHQGFVSLRVKKGRSLSLENDSQTSPNLDLQANLKANYLETDYLSFIVEDTGMGIESEELNKLFQPFSQTRSGLQSGEGTGLGLPISRSFVHLMGGNFHVTSQANKGSQFEFYIRYTPAQPVPLLTDSPPLQSALTLPASLQPKILAVEDHSTNRLFLVKMLKSMGFQVQEAENGQEAIDLWQIWQPDLILMDMRMPVMDGYTATQHIKSTPEGQKTIIIALTASAFEEQRQTVLTAGCDDFVRKPFRANTLFNVLCHHLKIAVDSTENKQQSPMAENDRPSFTRYTPDPLDQTSPMDWSEPLAAQSSDWRQQIQNAAAQGSDDRLLELLEQLPDDRSELKKQLRELVMDFRFDRILELVA